MIASTRTKKSTAFRFRSSQVLNSPISFEHWFEEVAWVGVLGHCGLLREHNPLWRVCMWFGLAALCGSALLKSVVRPCKVLEMPSRHGGGCSALQERTEEVYLHQTCAQLHEAYLHDLQHIAHLFESWIFEHRLGI